MSARSSRPGVASFGHPIPIGSSVPVYAVNDGKELFFEGFARVISRCESSPHWYRVRFQSEQIHRIRLILPPSLHSDPRMTVELIRELLRTRGLSPWSEFFPED